MFVVTGFENFYFLFRIVCIFSVKGIVVCLKNLRAYKKSRPVKYPRKFLNIWNFF